MAGGCVTDLVLLTSESCQQAACCSQRKCYVLVTVRMFPTQMAINRQTFPPKSQFERKQSGETGYSVILGSPAFCGLPHVTRGYF